MQTPTGQNYYLLPAEEIQKMLQQNANIIRKFITDVNSGSGSNRLPLIYRAN